MSALTQGLVTGRHRASTSYFNSTRTRLGSSGSEEGTTKRRKQKVETGRRPEWKDIADRSPTHKTTGPSGNRTL
jgi:hypothetical protein